MNFTNRISHTISITAVFVIGLLFSVGIVGAFSLFGADLAREDSQGAVSVTATYLAPRDKEATVSGVAFQLALNTHSVDLGQYDLEKISYLQFDDDEPLSGGNWDFTGSGHHYKGVLSFEQAVSPEVKTMRLLIRGIDGVDERVFEWDLSKI